MNNIMDKVNENMKHSEKLCELLNNNVKGDIKYSPSASNDEIRIKQILDKRELVYNTICLKDTIINEYSLEKIVDIIYTLLGMGYFTTSYPSTKEVELYDEFIINGWNVFFDNGVIWFDDNEIYISDILSKEINKEFIKFELDKEECDYSSVKIIKEGELFNLEYTE
jgi:hypothetical protein